MSTNLTPVPERASLAHQGIGALGAGSPVLGAGTGPKTSPVVRYLAALNRFKWMVLFLAVCGVGGGYFMSRLLPESYVVTGSFQVANNNENNVNPLQGGMVTTNDQWREFLQSYKVVTPVVISQQLFIIGPKKIGAPTPPPGPSGPDKGIFKTLRPGADFKGGDFEIAFSVDGSTWEITDTRTAVKQTGRVGIDSIGTDFKFEWFPMIESRWFGKSFTFTAITPREAADQLRNDLKINAVSRSRYIHLELAGQDKYIITGTINDLQSEAVRQALASKQSDLVQNSASLDSMQRTTEAAMRAAETALAAYQTRTVTTPRQVLQTTPGLAGTTGQGISEYGLMQTKLADLIRDRDAFDTTMRLYRSGQPIEDRLASIPDVANKAELMTRIRDLSTASAIYDKNLAIYQPGYRDATINMAADKQLIDRLRDSQIPNLAAAVRSRMSDRIVDLQNQIAGAKKQLEQIPTVTVTESKLQNELANATAAYNAVTSNSNSARMVEKTAIGDLTVLDNAEPPLLPKKNRRKVILAMGALLGLVAGLGLTFLLDVVDKRVRYADQITSGLGLTILGVVPEIRRIKGESSTVEEDSQVIEAFRTIRLNLAHAAPDGRLAITISSPAPAEGKSLVSSNLALSFAEAGYRTLLIDGDTRRGELHRTFGVDRRPGLIDYLADNHPVAELLRPTSHPLLTLMPSGSRKRNAPELLGSMKMRDLINSYRERYDVVIVDSPPLGAGIDPFVLGTLTSNLMLVVRAGATQKDLAEAKLQIVDQLPIRLVGAVLNDVQSSTNLYRYYSYSSGYAAFDEPESSGKLQVTSGSTDVTESK